MAAANPEQASPTFFRSRWVERPDHVRELEPTALPAGFRSAGVAAGIKPGGELDVGVLVCDRDDAVSSARFCANAVVGAPVTVSREADRGRLRGIVVNSGNANVALGDEGLRAARAAQRALAEHLGVAPSRVGCAATGVIGRPLPQELLLAGVERACGALAADADAFSRSIMTTDRWPKRACLEVDLPGGRVRLAAQAKGAGMIAPRFATMLCFCETDARVAPQSLELLTTVCVRRSFERISVDGQLSTSDSVFLLASGASGVEVTFESEAEVRLGEALDALFRQLALEIVADGEGTERVARVVVQGAPELVEPVARAVAESPLVKTALAGADPNVGRILQAAGQALAERRAPGLVDIEVEGIPAASAGVAVPLDGRLLESLERAFAQREVELELRVPGSGGATELFFSDLGHEYVRINAEYTT
ncbi:bifunctional glutamate N-acetyltransferase/amino-acid acetyltransferase ArgJ [Thermoleophilum album]|uniref:Arginine biosynthesis bifunctional protein ArgJ n=1 Tax=Thermoleophilum album TaxID=29539 RepID=A0A1H6FX61_THEAL|nr:bifunctional glutamate N-acetyltransferase/amino-acid acetyltransferase ArgJ [Thermoleophilum album]SEH15012.1 glutamate N-acetyltransferase [Thermoleophilum album]